MNIVAQMVVHNYQQVSDTGGQYWYNLGKDYVLPLILAIVAGCVAYYIFVSETKRDKQKELDLKSLERNDKLIFFSTSVDSAIKTATQQESYLKSYLRLIREDDVNFHHLQFVPLNNFQRIVEVLDLESYLLAYVNKYDANRTASIKEYKNILANIDYLYHNFKLIFEQVQRAQQFDYERKMEYKATFYKIFNALGDIYTELQDDQDSYQKFYAIIDNFTQNDQIDKYNITFYFEQFFTPIHEFCLEYFVDEKPKTKVLTNMAVASRDGKQMYEHIQVENQQLRLELVKDFKGIYKSILDLKKLASKLIADFN